MIGIGQTVTNTSDNITVFGNVIVQGQLALYNSTLNVTYLRNPPAPLVEHLGNILVSGNGRVEVVNSTVSFDVALTSAHPSPNGIRAIGTSAVTFRDYDLDPATTSDASHLLASQAVTSSTFGTDTRLVFQNSFAENATFTLVSSVNVSIDSSVFNFRPQGLPPSFPGITALGLGNGCIGHMENSSINGSSLAATLDSRAISGSQSNGIHLANLVVTGFQVGVFWAGEGASLSSITFVGHGTAVLFNQVVNASISNLTSAGAGTFPPPAPGAWPPPGTLVALVQSRNVTVSNLRVQASLAPSGARPVTLFALNNSWQIRVSNITSDLDSSLGDMLFASDVLLDNISATTVVGGLDVTYGIGVRIENVTAQGPESTFSFRGTQEVRIADVSIRSGGTLGMFLNATRNVTLERVSVWADVGLYVASSSQVALSDIALNATDTGLSLYGVTAVDVGRLSILGNGTAMVLRNVTYFSLDQATIQYGFAGLDLFGVEYAGLERIAVSSNASSEAGELLWVRRSHDVSLGNLSFQGNCTRLGRVQMAANISLVYANASGCQEGLEFESSTNIQVRHAILQDIWNGTALTFDTVTGVQVEHLGISGASFGGLSVSVVQGFRLSGFEVSFLDGAGAIIAASSDILVEDGKFWYCGGPGLVLLADSGSVGVSRVQSLRSDAGVSVVSTPNVTLTDVEASSNTNDGVAFDSGSTGAVLRNLTLLANRKNGVLVDAPGATLTDGNISANGWDGIAAGLGIRLSWTIEVAGSFTDGTARLPGDLTVAPGASFRAERATLRPDSTPISPRTAAWNVWSFGAGSTVLFDGLTVDAVNSSAAYTLSFANGSRATLNGSQINGAGRDDGRSLVIGSFAVIAIQNTTITGFNGPLEVTGGSLLLADALFIDNHAPVTAQAAQVTVSNLTVRDGDRDGFVLEFGGTLAGDRLSLIDNGGVGLRVTNLVSVTLADLSATGNQQGATVFTNTRVLVDGSYFSGNAAFAVTVSGGDSAALTNLTATANSGPGLRVVGTSTLDVRDCRFDRVGGHGLELDTIDSVRVTGCVIEGSGGFGISAKDVGQLTGRNMTFDRNSVSHIYLTDQTSASFRNILFHNSPGDAVQVRGPASVFLEDLLDDSTLGGVLAAESAYGYLLNATFPSMPRVSGNAEVDVAWKVRVEVVLEDGSPGASAAVEVWGARGALLANASTDGTGWTGPLEVLERTVYGARTSDEHVPQVFNATLPGGETGSATANITANADVTIRLDNTPPSSTFSMEGPAGGNGWFVGAVTVTIVAQDAGGGRVTLWWRATTLPSGWVSVAGDNGTATTSFAVTAEGRTIIDFYAVDESGNVEANQTASLRIDTQIPVVQLGPLPAVTSEREVPISWEVLDSGGSGNLTFLLQVQSYGGPWSDLLSGSTETSYTFLGDEGSYSFRLVGTDEAGHESGPSSATVQISLHGFLVIHAVDQHGADVPGATVTVEPAGGEHTVTGPLNLTLSPGAYRVVVTAPGYTTQELDTNVSAGEVTDAGTIVLHHFTVTSVTVDNTGLALLLLLLAVAAGAAWVVIRNRMGPPRLGSL